MPSRLGKWLSDAAHAQRVANEAATVLRVLVELLRDDEVQQVIDRMIVRRIAEPQWGPPVGRVLATLLAENRQEALIQLLADRAFQWSLNAGEVIQRVVERDSPTWSPRFVDHLVGDRIHRELMDFTDKVRRNPDHELRRSATRFLFEFADDLQHDPDTIARADAVKEQLMARDEIANAAATAWRTLKRLVLEGVDDPSSTLRTRIADTVVRIGESLRDDAELRDKVDNWMVRAAQHLVSQYAVEITAIITETIERWDAEEASRRIELHVGRDLQFIRINGTVVGALAGPGDLRRRAAVVLRRANNRLQMQALVRSLGPTQDVGQTQGVRDATRGEALRQGVHRGLRSSLRHWQLHQEPARDGARLRASARRTRPASAIRT